MGSGNVPAIEHVIDPRCSGRKLDSGSPRPERINPEPRMEHCIAKIVELVAQGRDDRRSILQLGYNLGRLSELRPAT